MSDYALGVITPFAVIAGLALIAGVAYLLVKLALFLNARTHVRLFERIKVGPNLADPFSTTPERSRYYDKATEFRDVLLRSPQMWMINLLGFAVLVVRAFDEVVDESITYACPACGTSPAELRRPEHGGGWTLYCRDCGDRFALPKPASGEDWEDTDG